MSRRRVAYKKRELNSWFVFMAEGRCNFVGVLTRLSSTCMDKTNPEEDEQVFRLLELLNEYVVLSNDSMRVKFIEGHLDLSRAKFNGARTMPHLLDMRPYMACKVVRPGFVIEDRLADSKAKAARKAKEKKKTESEVVKSEKGQAETDISEDVPKRNTRSAASTKRAAQEDEPASLDDLTQKMLRLGDSTGSSLGTTSVRNRKETQEVVAETTFRDPLHQFGGLVPNQLRSAQAHFGGALQDCVRLVQLQREITALLARIEPNATR